jgi:tRNA threonylcarbamoyladenosine biosynthesis protein TsaB
MLIVSFDIATEKMYLVLEKDNKPLSIRHALSTPRKYNSAMLIPAMVEEFRNNNINPSEIDFIAINSGPGSFTGIRAGGVIARTLGQFLDIPVVGVSSLEIYANACNSDKPKLVILDARRSKWYTGEYGPDNQEIHAPALKLNKDVFEYIQDKDFQIITEKALFEILESHSPLCFEDFEQDFGLILTSLAKEKLKTANNAKKEFAWYHFKPVYLQTPSISKPKRVNSGL